MPIDTPYNRMIANQYNEMNRAKVAYLDNHNLDSGSSASPAGYATTGYEPRRVGSGVGMYKKTHDCPKGRGLCMCENNEFKKAVGGNNVGLNPNVRASLALGAGLKANRTQRHGTLDQNEMTNDFSALASGEARGCGSARGRKRKGGDLMDYYNRAKKVVETGKKIYDVGKKAYDVGKEGYEVYKQVRGKGMARGVARGPAGAKPRLLKNGKGSARGEARGGDLMDYINKAKKIVETGKKVYDVGKKVYDVGKEGYDLYKQVRGKGSARGEARGKKPNARAMIVKKIMNEKGLKLIEASKYVKAHGLY